MVIAMALQVLVLGREKEGIPVDLIQVLDACMGDPTARCNKVPQCPCQWSYCCVGIH
jgi:hypothetical protein